jgi:glyoxylase-like metal-dependent hydrolase (beta-lactamase superfamily II)
MNYHGPFDVKKVVEFEWRDRDPEFLLRNVSAEMFAATRTARDPRFVNVEAARLIMSFHSYVISTGNVNILVDTCVGNHKNRPALAEWHMQERPYLETLHRAGFGLDDIDFVCCTHLHADHIGWNTQLEDGRWVPTFPKARYIFARREVEYWEQFHAADPDNPYRNSWADSVLPVLEAGRVDLVESDHEIASGIWLAPAPGHTPGNIVLELKQGSRRAMMCGDSIHHAVQIEKPSWSSNFCLDPVEAATTRLRLLERIADNGTVLLPAHFGGPTAVQVVSDDQGFFYC